MQRHTVCNWIALGAVMAGLVTMPSPSLAQQKNASPAESQSTSHATEQTKPSQGGPQEAIKVHGHWTIVIKNPDGSEASRHQFENALAGTSGNLLLLSLLNRSSSAGPWLVGIDGNLCLNGNGDPDSCFIIETALPSRSGPNFFPNLKIAIQQPTGPASLYTLALSGTAKAVASGSIATVLTTMTTCSGNVTPTSCTTIPTINAQFPLGFNFTTRTLGTPIPVQAGQSVDVTVALSFS